MKYIINEKLQLNKKILSLIAKYSKAFLFEKIRRIII